jgi:hypothetical protein
MNLLSNQTKTNAIVFSGQFCILYCLVQHCGTFNAIKADMPFRAPHLSWHIWSLHFQHCKHSLPLNYFLSFFVF